MSTTDKLRDEALALAGSDKDGDALDRCAFCLGGKGGLHGQELIRGGALLCLDCAGLFDDIVAGLGLVRPEPPVADQAALDALVRAGIVRARDQVANPPEMLATPFGGTVTDPDEVAMMAEMTRQNISVCARCWNTGHVDIDNEVCDCPSGVFLAKKLDERAATRTL